MLHGHGPWGIDRDNGGGGGGGGRGGSRKAARTPKHCRSVDADGTHQHLLACVASGRAVVYLCQQRPDQSCEATHGSLDLDSFRARGVPRTQQGQQGKTHPWLLPDTALGTCRSRLGSSEELDAAVSPFAPTCSSIGGPPWCRHHTLLFA